MEEYNNIFYSKAYVKFIEDTEKVKVNYFKFNEGKNFAFFPFVMKRNVLYGLRYGGIYTNCGKAEFIEKVRNRFLKYCREHDVEKIQIREGPFIKTVKIGKIIKKEPFIYIDLRESKNELKNKISRSHTRCIQKSIKRGLTFSEVNDLKYLKMFHKFYMDVMGKNGVVPRKFSYFIKMFSYLKNNLQLVCIKYKATIIAVSIILKSDSNIFMLYGGMSEAGYETYAKHFMIYSLIFGYKKKGYKRLVLGTGHNGRDSIYRFKKGFTDTDNDIYTYECRI